MPGEPTGMCALIGAALAAVAGVDGEHGDADLAGGLESDASDDLVGEARLA